MHRNRGYNLRLFFKRRLFNRLRQSFPQSRGQRLKAAMLCSENSLPQRSLIRTNRPRCFKQQLAAAAIGAITSG